MIKNTINANQLIKKKNLKTFLKQKGVKRINPQALEKIENYLIKKLEELANSLKENSIIMGKKNVQKKDVENTIKAMSENEYPEI